MDSPSSLSSTPQPPKRKSEYISTDSLYAKHEKTIRTLVQANQTQEQLIDFYNEKLKTFTTPNVETATTATQTSTVDVENEEHNLQIIRCEMQLKKIIDEKDGYGLELKRRDEEINLLNQKLKHKLSQNKTKEINIGLKDDIRKLEVKVVFYKHRCEEYEADIAKFMQNVQVLKKTNEMLRRKLVENVAKNPGDRIVNRTNANAATSERLNNRSTSSCSSSNRSSRKNDESFNDSDFRKSQDKRWQQNHRKEDEVSFNGELRKRQNSQTSSRRGSNTDDDAINNIAEVLKAAKRTSRTVEAPVKVETDLWGSSSRGFREENESRTVDSKQCERQNNTDGDSINIRSEFWTKLVKRRDSQKTFQKENEPDKADQWGSSSHYFREEAESRTVETTRWEMPNNRPSSKRSSSRSSDSSDHVVIVESSDDEPECPRTASTVSSSNTPSI